MAKLDFINTGPDDLIVIGPWPVGPGPVSPDPAESEDDRFRSRNTSMRTVSNNYKRVFTTITPWYNKIESDLSRWETFNSSQIIIYSLSHIFGHTSPQSAFSIRMKCVADNTTAEDVTDAVCETVEKQIESIDKILIRFDLSDLNGFNELTEVIWFYSIQY